MTCDLRSLQGLQKALRQGDWTATVAVHSGNRIIGVWPGFRDRAYGLAVDVGSTTIAGHLCDLASGEVIASAGLMNPQIRFGEDLMSRVSYVMMNPGGEVEMTRAVREAVATLAAQVAREGEIDPRDILELTFVGNPIMHHLLLGIDPTELGGAPFALATNEAITLWASELDLLGVHANARVYVLPCIAGHVGADTAGVVLSETPHLVRRGHADRRRRHQCRDRARQPPSPARGLLADRPGVRGRADLLRPARSAGAIERVRIDRARRSSRATR